MQINTFRSLDRVASRWFRRCSWIAATIAAFVTSVDAPGQESRPSGHRLSVLLVPQVLPETGQAIPIGRKPLLEAAEVGGDVWICGDGRIKTPLPVGYPKPTAPGAIELKSYPSIRRAEVSGSRMPDLASNLGFWKLFRHIKSRDIAMTAPVEMDYAGIAVDGSTQAGDWKMAFLYREPCLGDTGKDGDVSIVDSTPRTYLSAGALGSYGLADALRVLETLRAALAELDGFDASGAIRVLHYNGPEVRDGKRWFEVQVPVRQKAGAGSPTRG